jgi:hypothetical protein
MDNASFHHSDRIEEMCTGAGVKLVHLTSYSPDFNPIEECFSGLKAFITRDWMWYEQDPKHGFQSFLDWCIEDIGPRKQSAFCHRHAVVVIGTHD